MRGRVGWVFLKKVGSIITRHLHGYHREKTPNEAESGDDAEHSLAITSAFA